MSSQVADTSAYAANSSVEQDKVLALASSWVWSKAGNLAESIDHGGGDPAGPPITCARSPPRQLSHVLHSP